MDGGKLKKITTKLRPSKMATLVIRNQEWRDKCLKTIEIYSQIWGGAYNLIIPTDGNKIDENFWFLLEKFDPDYIAIFNDKNEDNRISNKLKQELFNRLNPFSNSKNKEIEIIKLSPNYFPHYPLSSLLPILKNLNSEIKSTYYYDINYAGSEFTKKNLELLYTSILGNINDQYSNNLKNISFGSSTLKWEHLNRLLASQFLNTRSSAYIYSPFSYSIINLEKRFVSGNYSKMKKSPAISVIGDEFEDFALYYNLSKLRNNVIWIPNEEILDLEEFLTDDNEKINCSFKLKFFEEMGNSTNLNLLPGKKVAFTSFSLSKDELSLFTNNLKKIITELLPSNKTNFPHFKINKIIEESLPYIIGIYEKDNQNWYVEQFFNNKSVNPIKTPTPIHYKEPENHLCWITDVSIEKYKLPQVRCLNDVFRAKYYSNNTIRISKQGISYFCPNVVAITEDYRDYIVKPHLTLIEPFEIFRRLFDKIGYLIEYSDDGLFEMESVAKFGSLNKITEILKNESCIMLFQRFIEGKNPENPEDGVMLKDNRIDNENNANNIIYMPLDTMRNLLTEMDEIDVFLSELLYRNIIQRGFIFKCKNCLNADWYHIKEITDTYTCKRCGKTQLYTKENLFRQKDKLEPQWFYKLDEVFYLGFKQNMDVPLLTLNNLKNESNESFIYINQIKLKRKDNPSKDFMEIDICGIQDGKIVIGECKKSKTLKMKTIEKYANIASELNAIGVFSTLDSDGFSDEINGKIADSFGENNYKIFTGKNLKK